MGIEEKLVRKRLEILLGDADLVESYLRDHGAQLDMNKVNQLKALRKKPLSGTTATAAGTAGENGPGGLSDPTYTLQVKCPVCLTPEITCHELKSKSLAVTFDRFYTPRYSPVHGFKAVNYNLFSVTVCPKCLFASPDKKDFITWSLQTKSDVKSQLGPFVLEELKKRFAERKAALPGITDYARHFAHPRTPAAGVDSYRLAILRALAETTLDVPLSFYKAAMYKLKIAAFLREAGKDDEAEVLAALPLLVKAFGRNESQNPDFEYQLLHILVAAHIRVKNYEGAQSFLGVLERLKTERLKAAAEDPGVKVGAVEKWLDNTKELWTDREDPDLWKH